jgi:hypothetical protein
VRCLACHHVYGKALDGSAGESDSGCPLCGYAGWAAVSFPFEQASRPRHSGEGPPPPLGAPRH